jgi:hypothetical protein
MITNDPDLEWRDWWCKTKGKGFKKYLLNAGLKTHAPLFFIVFVCYQLGIKPLLGRSVDFQLSPIVYLFAEGALLALFWGVANSIFFWVYYNHRLKRLDNQS